MQLAGHRANDGVQAFFHGRMDVLVGQIPDDGGGHLGRPDFVEVRLRLPHLGLRMAEHSRRALYIATKLAELGLPVAYPGLATHPDHALLARLANPGFGSGGVLALDLPGHGRSEGPPLACIEDIAAFADIGPFFEQPMRTYSMGMIARVAFAICAHAKADVLIVDEALSVGDEIFQRKCEKYIAEFAKTGTILMVSHDLNFLASLCNRVLWLEGGVVREMGDPQKVVSEYRKAMRAEEGQASGVA